MTPRARVRPLKPQPLTNPPAHAFNDRRWCVALRDLIDGPQQQQQQQLQQCVAGSYMVDLPWLLHQVPPSHGIIIGSSSSSSSI